MSLQEIITLSGTHQVGSLGWRHLLTWRQLSALWRIPVSHHLPDTFRTTSGAAAYSIAIARGECDDYLLQHCYGVQSPVIIFLDRAVLRSGGANGFAVEFKDHYRAEKRLRHVLRLEQRHPLVEGLPETVLIYGECPIVTPLRTEDGTEVLVSLDGIPIIGFLQHCLFVGADPWQLGVPSVPMIYKILSNWLLHKVRYKHRILDPYAAIRLDDLPTTAEKLRLKPPTRKLDRDRARTMRRLRRFGHSTGTKFTFMYSSHFPGADGSFISVSSIMPRSIREMQLGVQEGVFEVGSHGMVHLRNGKSDQSSVDSREFLDLDEHETITHLEKSDDEILRLFGTKPQSFVAPDWVYRPGVTKTIAAQRYPAIVDSSQHVESGECDIFLTPGQEGDYLNITETFRPGNRMLTYSRPEFWQCYAGAGIPIHYMQHMDTNWHILRSFLKGKTVRVSETSRGGLHRLLELAEDPRRPLYIRALCAALLITVNCCLEPSSWQFVWIALTRSSIYSFVRAMKSAGYKCGTLTELRTRAMDYGLRDLKQFPARDNPSIQSNARAH
jgi:hypothetical protein